MLDYNFLIYVFVETIMEGTENFHKTCAPVNVQAKEIHFAAAIGVIRFTRQVRVFYVHYKQLKSSFQVALVRDQ